ncbi:hypothetical protein RintRC_4364 [Richelia intracellularis]|nr:hypothetical protein RintRC_4364 [Richelia intracellularis]
MRSYMGRVNYPIYPDLSAKKFFLNLLQYEGILPVGLLPF